ncbi:MULTISPECIES: class I SAM-dependent methyltransferase [Streptomyces]|uniref:Class I SAM-dependent methyltransferase n=1 Tax=Streptomyces lycii TaxID=2654337 RepID=A0ABQ7FFU3_9ACTN|nr:MULTISPECIES: class I SAM-dependent methyltransferase [Streptomyces]KAF4407515.1 class I SAM-dependent methyltransferase [Streptomyces lycii]PGH52184.1 ubiquinone biosynthesis methyltransferase UbiE [Streptomyces sp. Ru87]
MTQLRDGALSAAFDRASGSYDRLVGASPGYHAQLRLSARRLQLPGRGEGLRVLDLGCGTGASTAALLAVAPRARITAADASAGMLGRAAAKRWAGDVEFVHAAAEELGSGALRGPFDAVFAAYLLRNVPAPDAVLRGTRSVLRPGGRLGVHEYALSGSPRHRAVWSALCWGVVIPAGALSRGGPGLYRYLWRSVLDFDTAPAFRTRLAAAGFDGVRAAPVPGWQRGIVHTFVANAPSGAGR